MAGKNDAQLNVDITASGAKATAEIQGVHKAISDLAGGPVVGLQKGFHSAAQELSELAGVYTGNRLSGLTTRITELGEATSHIPGATGLAIGALAGLGAILFEVTEKAAKYGKEIFDASEKTGLSTETISALKYAADLNGSSLEQLTKGIVRFTVTMGAAAHGSQEAKDKLADLHVTSKNLDEGFAQAVKSIAESKNEIDRTRLATDAFGKKMGAELIPLILSFKGNLPALIAKLQEMGLVMSKEDARASKEFADTLSTLEKQAGALGRQFAVGLMIPVTHAMSEISGSMKDNKSVAKDWGESVGRFIRNVLIDFQQLDIIAKTYNLDIEWLANTHIIGGTDAEAARKKEIEAALADLDAQFKKNLARQLSPADAHVPGTTEAKEPPSDEETAAEARKAAEERQKELEDRHRRELAAQAEWVKTQLEQSRETLATMQDDAEQAFLKKEITEKEFMARSGAAYKFYSETVSQYLKEQFKLKNIDLTKTEYANLVREIQSASQAALDLIKKSRENRDKTIADSKKKDADEERKRQQEAAKDAHAIYEEDVANFGSTQEKKLAQFYEVAEKMGISEANQARMAEQLAAETLAFKLAALNKYADGLTVGTDEYRKALVEIARLEDTVETHRATNAKNEAKRHKDDLKYWDDALTALREIEDEQEKIAKADAENDAKERARIKGAEKAQSLGGMIGGLGLQPLLDPKTLQPLNAIKSAIIDLKQIGVDAFQSLGSAVGSLVENWVLMGTAGPNAMKKMVASVLAGVAAQSAVLAIFELAKGFAALFWNPVEASAHFQAAALFGILAVGSGLAGRAVAGNAFQQQTANGGAGATAGGSAASSGTNPLTDANNPQNRFTEAFNGFTKQISKIQDRANVVLGGVEEQLHRFNEQFGAVSPSHVVMAGADGASSSIFNAITSELGRGARPTEDMIRAQGRYR